MELGAGHEMGMREKESGSLVRWLGKVHLRKRRQQSTFPTGYRKALNFKNGSDDAEGKSRALASGDGSKIL